MCKATTCKWDINRIKGQKGSYILKRRVEKRKFEGRKIKGVKGERNEGGSISRRSI